MGLTEYVRVLVNTRRRQNMDNAVAVVCLLLLLIGLLLCNIVTLHTVTFLLVSVTM